MSKGIMDNFEVLTLNTIKLYASKINALLSRATPRDLYDVNAMIENNMINNSILLRKCLVFYNAIGGDYDLQNVDFKNIKRLNFQKFKTQLKPVIAKDDEFEIESAKKKVIEYLRNLLELTPNEKMFLSNMKEKHCTPELLFDDTEIVANIENHPAALLRTE